MDGEDLLIQQNQYHGCWWPGDARSHAINSHDIGLVRSEYSGFTAIYPSDIVNTLTVDDLATQVAKTSAVMA